MPKNTADSVSQMSLWLDTATESPSASAPAAKSASKAAEPLGVAALPPLSAQQKNDAKTPLHAWGMRLLAAVRTLDPAAAKAAGGAKTLFRLFARPGAGQEHPRADGPLGVVQMALTQALALTPQTPRSDAFLSDLISEAGVFARKHGSDRFGDNPLAGWLNQLAHMAAINGNSTLWGAAFDAAGARAELLSPLLPLCLPFGGEAFIHRAIQNANAGSAPRPGKDIAETAFLMLADTTKEPEITGYTLAAKEGANASYSRDPAVDDFFDADGFSRLDAMKAILSCQKMPQNVLDLALAMCAGEHRIETSVFLLQNGAHFTKCPLKNGHTALSSALETASRHDAPETNGGFSRLTQVALELTKPEERSVPNKKHNSVAKKGSSEWTGDEQISWVAVVLCSAEAQHQGEHAKTRVRQLMSHGVFPFDEMEARFCMELAAELGDARFLKELAREFKKAGVPPAMSNSPIITRLQDMLRYSSSRRDAALADMALAFGDMGAPTRLKSETAKAIGPNFFAANEALRLRQALKDKTAKRPQMDLDEPSEAPAPVAASSAGRTRRL